MNPEDCLPADLRARSPVITKITAGLSGAGVYQVVAGEDAYVLRVNGEETDPAVWRRYLAILRLAAGAGLAPRVVHVDEHRLAVLSAFVEDRSFIAFYQDPATQPAAVELLGRTFRRLHALPIPAEAMEGGLEARKLLSALWPELRANLPLPGFADDLVRRMLDTPEPPSDRAPVLGHNDPNPTNLVYDGTQLLLIDWDTAGVQHPFYDLAAVAMFLRMSDDLCLGMLSAYEGAPVDTIPERFRYARRLVALFCGATFLGLARAAGHPGDATGTLQTTLSIGTCYQLMQKGLLRFDTAAGQWQMGLALLKESVGNG